MSQKTRFGIQQGKRVASTGEGLKGWKTCQFIEGEPSEPMCGEPSITGSSYCARHHEICWMTAPRSGKASASEKSAGWGRT